MNIIGSIVNLTCRNFFSAPIALKKVLTHIFPERLSFQQRYISMPATFCNPEGPTVKKAGKIGLFLLLGGALLTPFSLCASESDISTKQPIILSTVQGVDWVRKCVQVHPEILWLADANVRKTEEGHASLQGTYSEQLFGQKYVEFDRTIMTLECLRLILDGSEISYQTFTSAQKEGKLSYESFQSLHHQGKKLLQSKYLGLSEREMAQAMETALVLGDMGKSEKARALFRPYGISAPDHDDFHGEAMHVIEKHPELCPSFAKLPIAAKELLVKVANLAHYGHVTHLEGGTGMFHKLKESKVAFQDPTALAFDLFVHTCDVAGALGHVNNKSSIVYTEPTHNSMQAMWSAVKVLSDPNKTELDAYNTYLSTRASWLSLSSEDQSDRVLSRIGAMLRLFTPAEGAVLRKAMVSLGKKSCDQIADALDVSQKDLLSRTPTYMPAVLVNLANNNQLGSSKEERLAKAIQIGLPFIARVLEKHKKMLEASQIDSKIPLNFNKAAGIAKESPYLLANEFEIDREGNVICL